jgi:hypothetical protein
MHPWCMSVSRSPDDAQLAYLHDLLIFADEVEGDPRGRDTAQQARELRKRIDELGSAPAGRIRVFAEVRDAVKSLEKGIREDASVTVVVPKAQTLVRVIRRLGITLDDARTAVAMRPSGPADDELDGLPGDDDSAVPTEGVQPPANKWEAAITGHRPSAAVVEPWDHYAVAGKRNDVTALPPYVVPGSDGARTPLLPAPERRFPPSPLRLSGQVTSPGRLATMNGDVSALWGHSADRRKSWAERVMSLFPDNADIERMPPELAEPMGLVRVELEWLAESGDPMGLRRAMNILTGTVAELHLGRDVSFVAESAAQASLAGDRTTL